jgi:hypothetical protein
MRLIWALMILGVAVLVSAQTKLLDPHYTVTAPSAAMAPTIDWTQGAIFVTTEGKAATTVMGPRAHDVAFDDAKSKGCKALTGVFDGVKLTGYATIADAVKTGLLPVLNRASLCSGLTPVIERWNSEKRTLYLTSALPLTGPGSLNAVAADVLLFEQKLLVPGKPNQHPVADIVLKPGAPPAQLTQGPYSGLILDCRGLGFAPILLPKLVAKDGTEIWGTEGINPLAVKEIGLVAYAKDLRAALSSRRAGDTPLIVRPIGTAGALRGNLVLRAEDIQLLKDQQAASTFLSTLAIVILLD